MPDRINPRLALEQHAIRYASKAWYMSNRTPLQRHLCWQSPLATSTGASRDERLRRMARAGDIWLRNYDLRFYGQLWLTDMDSETSLAFRRARRPGEPQLTLGPVPVVLVKHGARLFDSPIVYAETDEASLDEIWQDLLKRAAIHKRRQARVTRKARERSRRRARR